MNWEIKIPLIFWNFGGHCAIKSFRIQNFLISLKTVYIEANMQKLPLRFWNVALYDVIVLNAASTEEDQCPLLHHCLFSPAHNLCM